MLSYLRYPLLVMLWVVALMSGALSLFRELYGMYSGAIPPRSLFWSCTWIAFVVTATILWCIEHYEKIAEQKKHQGARIEGKIFFGYVDAKKYLGDGKWESQTDRCVVTVYIQVVNHNDQEGWLRTAPTLQLSVMEKQYTGKYLMIPLSQLAVNDDTLDVNQRRLFDFFTPLFGWDGGLAKGKPWGNWLMFEVNGLDPNFIWGKNDVPVHAVVLLTDTLGKSHPIPGDINLKVGKLCSLSN